MKAKPAIEQEMQAFQTKVTFCFNRAESELLDKIANQVFRTKSERRLAFLLIGRWCLANWHKLSPSFHSHLNYSRAEGLNVLTMTEAMIAQQSKLFGKRISRNRKG